jgi:hypothetical protein
VSQKSIEQQLFREAELSGAPQFVYASQIGVSDSYYSLAKRGRRRLSKRQTERFATALLRVKQVRAKFANAPLDWGDADFRESEFRKLEGGHVEIIPQTRGSQYIHEFAAQIKLGANGPARFVACAQMPATIINAPIITGDGQVWIEWWADGMRAELGQRSFRDFVAENGGDENKGLELLANRAFARILAARGREQVLLMMASLLRSGELKAATAAGVGKN